MTCSLSDCSNLSCTGIKGAKFDVDKSETIIAYVDRIYDGKIGPGAALVHQVTTDTVAYGVNAEFTPCTSCCGATCNIGVGATFTIESAESTLDFLRVGNFDPDKVLVNGTAVSDVETVTSNTNQFIATLAEANNVPNPICKTSNIGTKSSIVLNSISGWGYMATHKLTGKVLYQGQACKFCVIVKNTKDVIQDISGTSTLLIPEMCIPDVKSRLFLQFRGNISLLNPTLSVVANGNDTRVVLQSSVILNPEIIGEVVLNTRVRMLAMM